MKEGWERKVYSHFVPGDGGKLGARSLNRDGPAVCAGACLHRHRTQRQPEGGQGFFFLLFFHFFFYSLLIQLVL